jgi:hypothetical protein
MEDTDEIQEYIIGLRELEKEKGYSVGAGFP